MSELVEWKKVGERLRKIRKEKRLSQREFGRQFNVSQNMVSLYEKGKSRAPVEFYIQAAHFGGRSVEWVLLGRQDHLLETLRQMQALYEKIQEHLAAVRQLLDRETREAVHDAMLTVEDGRQLEQMLSRETQVPGCIREALAQPALWESLHINGRELRAFCSLTQAFGDIEMDGLKRFLQIVRSAKPVVQASSPAADPPL
ncbi:MAG: helix-turn-helix domain-containing protein [Candidatus Sumerlaeia bacterium]|nr:helix-turn-helix domain-containing protein [Candidatus Sumerlaeia bacterium]